MRSATVTQTVKVTFTDSDLALSQPANITTPATSASGAVVTYALPTVSDHDDALPPASTCTPASGSVFAGGITTVTCSATDNDDTPSTVTTSFTVDVTLAVVTSSLPDATLGSSYQAAVVAGGGTGPYTFSLAPGSAPLPTGLSLNPTTGPSPALR